MRPIMKLLLGRCIGDMSSNGKSDQSNSHIITVGGSNGSALRSANRNKASAKDGSHFRRLDDNDSEEDPVLWPENYNAERMVSVQGQRGASVPLKSIRVQKDMTWTETTVSQGGESA
jgi:hypothetical protein